jgi:hypothetical protein
LVNETDEKKLVIELKNKETVLGAKHHEDKDAHTALLLWLSTLKIFVHQFNL